jgi:DNA-binding CsgD family transcriptional regulator
MEVKMKKKGEKVMKLFEYLIESPCDWSYFYQNFSEALNIDGFSFIRIQKELPKLDFFLTFNLDEVLISNLKKEITKNFPLLDFLKNVEENETINGNDLVKNEEINKDKELENLFKGSQFKYFLIIGILNNFNENLILFALREKRNGSFSNKEINIFKRLSNLLKLSYIYCSKLEKIENYTEILKKAIEYEGKGIILLDKNSKIVLLNRIASNILSKKEGIELTKDGIEIMDPVLSLHFKKYIRKALSSEVFDEDFLMAIPKKGKGIPTLIQMLPIKENFNINENSKKILIVLYDPSFSPIPNFSFLTQAFQFTLKENQIAALLSKGMDLKEIAKELGISLHTVRTHLKHIYSKTNTSRQAELIKLLLCLPQNI